MDKNESTSCFSATTANESEDLDFLSSDPELEEILSGFVDSMSSSSVIPPESPLSPSSSTSSSDIEIHLKANHSETEEPSPTAVALTNKKHVKLGCTTFHNQIPPNVRLPIRKGGMHLWQFLYAMLLEPIEYSNLIEWTINKESFEFRLLEPEAIAMWWGYHKNKKNMSYDKLSRSLRYYYDKCIIRKMSGERYVYRFCIDPELMYTAIGNSENRPQLKPLPMNVKYMLLSKVPAKDKSPFVAEEAEHVTERYQRKRSSPEYSPDYADTTKIVPSYNSDPAMTSPSSMMQQASPLHYSTTSTSYSCCTAESSSYYQCSGSSLNSQYILQDQSTSSYQHFSFAPSYTSSASADCCSCTSCTVAATAAGYSSPLSHFSENTPGESNTLFFFNPQTITTGSFDTIATTTEYPSFNNSFYHHLQHENQYPSVQYTSSTTVVSPLLESLSTSTVVSPLLESLSTSTVVSPLLESLSTVPPPPPYELFNSTSTDSLWSAGGMPH